jgi:hypothetical protein
MLERVGQVKGVSPLAPGVLSYFIKTRVPAMAADSHTGYNTKRHGIFTDQNSAMDMPRRRTKASYA